MYIFHIADKYILSQITCLILQQAIYLSAVIIYINIINKYISILILIIVILIFKY